MSVEDRSQLQAFPAWFLNHAGSDPRGLQFVVHSGTDATPTYIWTSSLGLRSPTSDADRAFMADDTVFPAQIRASNGAFTCGPNELEPGPGE